MDSLSTSLHFFFFFLRLFLFLLLILVLQGKPGGDWKTEKCNLAIVANLAM